MTRFFTAESVTSGHPDKVCDYIADSILDATIALDPNAHTAIEVSATTDFVLVMGEITATALPDVEAIVRQAIREIGYTRDDEGFSADTVKILNLLHGQSPDIAMGVNNSIENVTRGEDLDTIGAGDQGMMFGYACTETEELMPLGISLSHALTRRLEEVRVKGILPYVRPDGKAQVTVEYDNGAIKRIDCIVVSTQHLDTVTTAELREGVKREVIDVVVPAHLVDDNTAIYINPTGKFVVGGPHGDSGLTGRKLVVDSYGSYCPHGGGATSGKDPTKVDRSAAYFMRYVAKNIVGAGLCTKVQLQVAYAIGKAEPVSISVECYGTEKYPIADIEKAIRKVFDFRPKAIIAELALNTPTYRATTNYGNYGKSQLRWEQLDKVDALQKVINGDD